MSGCACATHGGVWQGSGEAIDQLFDALCRGVISVFRIGVARNCDVGDDDDALANVVEYQHRVGEQEDGFGDVHAGCFIRNLGNAWFEVFDGIVCDVADSAAVEFRQTVDFGITDVPEPILQHVQWVDVSESGSCAGSHHFGRFGSEERVSGDVLATLHAFEEEGVVSAGDFNEGRNWRFQVS